MSATDLGAKLGVTERTIYRYEEPDKPIDSYGRSRLIVREMTKWIDKNLPQT